MKFKDKCDFCEIQRIDLPLNKFTLFKGSSKTVPMINII